MFDIAMKPQPDGSYDFAIKNGDIDSIDGFDTAIYMSLLTDQRATIDDVPIPERRRGWLGDLNSPVAGRKIGSLLWLLDQRRLTQENLNKAISFALDSEQWLIDDDVAQGLNVSGNIHPGLGIQLIIDVSSDTGATSTKYVKLWEATGAN